MSKIDPEVLYLILTKVAAKESFYNYEPSRLDPGQTPGTITQRQLGEVYERITCNRPGVRLNWDQQFEQLNSLLLKCGLPPLGAVVVAEKNQGAVPPSPESLNRVHAVKWPPFGNLKNLYRKGK